MARLATRPATRPVLAAPRRRPGRILARRLRRVPRRAPGLALELSDPLLLPRHPRRQRLKPRRQPLVLRRQLQQHLDDHLTALLIDRIRLGPLHPRFVAARLYPPPTECLRVSHRFGRRHGACATASHERGSARRVRRRARSIFGGRPGSAPGRCATRLSSGTVKGAVHDACGVELGASSEGNQDRRLGGALRDSCQGLYARDSGRSHTIRDRGAGADDQWSCSDERCAHPTSSGVAQVVPALARRCGRTEAVLGRAAAALALRAHGRERRLTGLLVRIGCGTTVGLVFPMRSSARDGISDRPRLASCMELGSATAGTSVVVRMVVAPDLARRRDRARARSRLSACGRKY
jgi:hypothetical protein